MMTETINPMLCPLCRGDNACGNIALDGDPKKTCWCNSTDIQFPKALTEKIAPELRRKACICEKCTRAFQR